MRTRQPEKPLHAAYWGAFIGFCVLYFNVLPFLWNVAVLAAIMFGFIVSRSEQQRKLLRTAGDRLEAWRSAMHERTHIPD
jgi:hypothetical protein